MKLLFIHHSVGANLIRQGKIRSLLKDKKTQIEFFDHSYNLSKFFPKFFDKFTNRTGLSDNKGKAVGKDYDILLSNNSPKEYAEIFSRDITDKTLSHILEYNIVAFKNCYHTTQIKSDAQLEEYKNYYKDIKNSLRKYSDKKFILITPPPLRIELTKRGYSTRAKTLMSFLTSSEFNKKPTNLYVFDLFNLLANEDGVLKDKYKRLFPFDSHPNKLANKEIAPVLVDYIISLS